MQKPTLPKGTRDFGPVQMARRNFVFDTIKRTFQQFGFLPLETPAMENLSVLTGKYGDEGDQLLFKILDSGDYYGKMLKNILPIETMTRISDFLDEAFGIIIDLLKNQSNYKEIPNDFLRNQSIINSLENALYNYVYLDDSEKHQIRTFFYEGLDSISFKIKLFLNNIYADSPNEVEFRYKQFKNTTLNDFKNFILERITSKEATREISEKGLRYDLTVPFARYVVMNRNDIAFPFKRYQIQPVWRADRPQKGRYREFYQCDADVVGTHSLICEAEIVCMMNQVLIGLGITNFTIKINSRKILSGIIEAIQAQEQEQKILTIIDKLDKIGENAVINELLALGISWNQLEVLKMIFSVNGSNNARLEQLRKPLTYSSIGYQGINEIEEIFSLVYRFGLDNHHLEFDPTLARGLSYYTGAIFEVKVNNVSIGSISGGGRYDNLTGAFGLPGVSGVGFSFGVDRIYDVMEELGLFPAQSATSTRVLLVAFDAEAQRYALPVLRRLREAGVNSELYPDPAKLKKQLDYANAKGIPYVVLIGSNEMATGQLALKDMAAGTQQSLGLEELINTVRT